MDHIHEVDFLKVKVKKEDISKFTEYIFFANNKRNQDRLISNVMLVKSTAHRNLGIFFLKVE